jgi:hypothetical protein
LKKNISADAVALLLISLMLLSSLTFLSSNIAHGQGDITFWSGVSMRFGTGIQIQFIDLNGDGMLEPCDYCQWISGIMPPTECSWWEVLDSQGSPTGFEFHVDVAGPVFHIDYTYPGPIPVGQAGETIVAEKKIEVIEPCDYYVVHSPQQWWPEPCTWWEIINPETGELTGYEFHVDWTNESCEFHIDTVTPDIYILPFPYYEIEVRQKIINIEPCDWFTITDPSMLPQSCSWWRIILPKEWTGVIFHVDSNDGIDKFHVDVVNGTLPSIDIPPYNVTAEPYTPTTSQWYVKPPYPDYALSGMPDFDEKQDNWGPGVGIYTWCGPVAAANSLWWLDSEFESIFNPAPVPPPTISDSFPLVTAYGLWDDHSPSNVDPLVRNLALLMDTDGQMSHDGHTGTRWQDMVSGIQQYLIQQGVAGMFEVHFGEFPEFELIESEIERCQDVVLFLEFYQFTGSTWTKLYDNPSLESGHFVTCAGVNSTTYQLLISDPYQDAFENGYPGRSPVSHPAHADPTVHNDTQYVSQDAYGVAPWMPAPPSPYGPMSVWELVGYLQTMGYDPSWHAFIRAAVITSPQLRNISVTHVDAPAIVNRGDTISGRANVSVTVQNNGMMTESFFDVWVCAEGVEFGRQTIISLDPSAETTLTFQWNTTGYTWGNYTIEAYAENLTGETTYVDNYLLYGDLLVKLIGDLGSRVGSTNTFGAFDGAATSTDLSLFLLCYKATAPPEYMYLGDLGSRVGSTNTFFAYDGSVTSTDLSLFLQCYKGGGP